MENGKSVSNMVMKRVLGTRGRKKDFRIKVNETLFLIMVVLVNLFHSSSIYLQINCSITGNRE